MTLGIKGEEMNLKPLKNAVEDPLQDLFATGTHVNFFNDVSSVVGVQSGRSKTAKQTEAIDEGFKLFE